MVLATFIMIILTWVMLFPLDTLNLIRKLRTQHRQNMAQRHGQRGAKILSKRLHTWAAEQGFDTNLVDEILAEHQDILVQQLGEKYTQEQFSD